MSTQPVAIRDIKGLTPAVEPMNSEQIYALSGKNYIFDSLGPKSIYGNTMLTPHRLEAPAHTQGFRLKLLLGDRVFVMTGQAIMEWSESLGGFRTLYVTPNTLAVPHRWTFGYLNGIVFFCHPRTGLLEYELATDRVKKVEGPGVPELAVALAVNNGRLCVVDTETFYWSAGGNGRDFDPKLGGPGFQLLRERISGDLIMITPYSKGALTWCTGGVMRSEFTGDVEVYRHRAINTEFRPINSFCTVQLDEDTVVILDERGLFKTQGESPVPYAPLFNEFLIGYIQRYNLRVGTNIRIEWDDLQRLMYVSVSLSFENPIYERCFVLYPPLDKWGIFADLHYGILPGLVRTGSRADDYYSFVDSQGYLRLWEQLGYREVLPTAGNLNLFYPTIQKPTQDAPADPGEIVSSSFSWQGFDAYEVNARAGYYEPTASIPVALTRTGLEASLRLGLIRFQPNITNDQMSEMLNIKVTNVLSGDGLTLSEDYNLVPPDVDDEDYNLGVGNEDLGLDPVNYVNHGLRVIGSIDGVTAFMTEIPTLVTFTKNARHYTCSVTGIWHILEFTATEVGETFHIRSVELTAADAGRMA